MFLLFLLVPLSTALYAANADLEALLDDDFEEEQEIVVYDPLEPVNRVFFTINDRLYFWLLKPVGKVYTAVLADEAVRGCISAAFHNILAPVRVVNNLLQGKFKQSGTEVARFTINTVLGAGGLGDPAAEEFGLTKADEDFGQTLGFYGLGEGIYICWPLFGPSSARDTVGMAADYFLNPMQYLFASNPGTNAGLTALKIENAATLHGKDYEGLVNEAFDPYVAFRDIYYQHRRSIIGGVDSPGRQDKVAQKDKAFFQEQCPDDYGNASFRNLAKARKYQQCLENTGAHTSLSRTLKQGHALYLVGHDDRKAREQEVAMVKGVVGKDDLE
ncbi:MAG: VacJ family lipoprotein [Thermodesulfobacteriota bacterium]